LAAETKLWRQSRRHASDVRLVNRGLSGQPIAAGVQFEGSLGGTASGFPEGFQSARGAMHAGQFDDPSSPALMNDRSETDCLRTIAAQPDCQAPRGRCTNEALLSGNRLQKRYLGEPV